MTVSTHIDRGRPAGVGTHGVQRRLGGLLKHLPAAPDRWLDLGCGNGAYTIEIAKRARRVVGVDLSAVHLRDLQATIATRALLNVTSLQGTAGQLPFRDATFEVVSLIEVLEHVDADDLAIRECHRVLRSRGWLALSVPNKWYPFDIHGAQIGPFFLSSRVPFISWLPDAIHRRIARARIYTATR